MIYDQLIQKQRLRQNKTKIDDLKKKERITKKNYLFINKIEIYLQIFFKFEKTNFYFLIYFFLSFDDVTSFTKYLYTITNQSSHK
jgi:hypothetical protein